MGEPRDPYSEAKDDDTVRLLREHWQDIGFDAATARVNARGALEREPSLEVSASLSMDSLPCLLTAEGEQEQGFSELSELQMGQQLGLGGMGIVQLAVQIPLQREVAVKRIREDRRSARHRMALLREARITGRLEHPNIVPVHVLGCDQVKDPLFVMKRIEGVPWGLLMHDSQHDLRKDDERDHLEWNLDILMQLCNAVAFAHSKGILHRDLKPANVMVGPFGEVYLVDWGLAVERLDGENRLPDGEDGDDDIVGTPSYMAPEMVMGSVEELSERTDSFLLGAILFEIMTGQAPHKRESMEESLISAYACDPFVFPAGLPQELVQICKKATKRDPADRYESVEAFRKDLAHFLQHRHSLSLCHEAQTGLEALEQLVGRPIEEQPTYQSVHGVFLEAQFGFQQALRAWEQNIQARSGLAELREVMAHYELSQGHEKAAAVLISQLESPGSALPRKLAALRKEKAEEAERIEALERFASDHDADFGQGTRGFLTLLLSAIYLPFLVMFSESIGRLLGHGGPLFTFHMTAFVVFGMLFFAWSGIATFGARHVMWKSSINRAILVSMWGLSIALASLPWGCAFLEISSRKGFAITSLFYALTLGGFAGMLDRRLLWAALVFLLGFFASALWLDWIFEIKLIVDMVALSYVAYLWRPIPKQAPVG
ncbi:MAG: protein kinase [Myxococcales bacterium]|nr:protein kinase [Myxococcales bacterium]